MILKNKKKTTKIKKKKGESKEEQKKIEKIGERIVYSIMRSSLGSWI